MSSLPSAVVAARDSACRAVAMLWVARFIAACSVRAAFRAFSGISSTIWWM